MKLTVSSGDSSVPFVLRMVACLAAAAPIALTYNVYKAKIVPFLVSFVDLKKNFSSDLKEPIKYQLL